MICTGNRAMVCSIFSQLVTASVICLVKVSKITQGQNLFPHVEEKERTKGGVDG